VDAQASQFCLFKNYVLYSHIMNTNLLAFDKESQRSYDSDGRLHIARSNISKAQVSQYYGYEIPNSEELGLEQNKLYSLLRDPEELAKSAKTFNNLPILSEHTPVSADNPEQKMVIGSIGSDVDFEFPYLFSSTCIWVSEEIAGIEEQVKDQWSCSYKYDVDMTPGIFEGKKYDGVMRNIRGNHLALVESGRAGADVYAADSNLNFLIKKGYQNMKMSKIGGLLSATLKAISPKLAADANFPNVVSDVKKTSDRKILLDKIFAMDEGVSREQLDSILDAVLGVEQGIEEGALDEKEVGKNPFEKEEKAEDAEESDLEKFLKSKGLSDEEVKAACAMASPASDQGYDAEEVDKKVNEKIESAMDAQRKEFKALESAKSEVRGIVGEVFGMDSAKDVYKFALKHLAVDHKDINELPALRALVQVATNKNTVERKSLANDSVGLFQKFPGLSRIK
jgi:hypothetical protein